MVSIIKNAYVLFLKKLPLCGALILPLIVFSYIDEYLKNQQEYWLWMKIGGILVLTLTELALYKYVMQFQLGNAWQVIKKTILISVYQVIVGTIMLIPVLIAVSIAQHHNIMSEGYLLICFVVNIFLGGWFFTKSNALVPMMAVGEKWSWHKCKEYTHDSYKNWAWVSLLLYFPYVVTLYLIGNALISIIVSSLFVVAFTLFNGLFYQSKK